MLKRPMFVGAFGISEGDMREHLMERAQDFMRTIGRVPNIFAFRFGAFWLLLSELDDQVDEHQVPQGPALRELSKIADETISVKSSTIHPDRIILVRGDKLL